MRRRMWKWDAVCFHYRLQHQSMLPAQTAPCCSLIPMLMPCDVQAGGSTGEARQPLQFFLTILTPCSNWDYSLTKAQNKPVSSGTSSILHYIRRIEHSFPLWLPLLFYSYGQHGGTEMVPRVIFADISWTSAWEHKHPSRQYRAVTAGHYACYCGVLIG